MLGQAVLETHDGVAVDEVPEAHVDRRAMSDDDDHSEKQGRVCSPRPH
jgi:hypothetical protein